jgi:CheY-specific phosphatase CheX
MSSPRWPQPRPAADGLRAIGAAAVQVAESSLFACAELCESARFAELLRARAADEPWLAATVGFTGPFEGAAHLALPRAVAADLAGAFSGSTPGDLSARSVADFAGELANMVCGRWLTDMHRADRFDLAAPLVTHTATAAVARTIDATADAIGLSLNDAPVLIALVPGSRRRASLR